MSSSVNKLVLIQFLQSFAFFRSTAVEEEDVKFFKKLNRAADVFEGKTQLSRSEIQQKEKMTHVVLKNLKQQLKKAKTKSIKCIDETDVKISVLEDSSMTARVVCPLCSKVIKLSVTKYNSVAVHNFTKHVTGSHEDPALKTSSAEKVTRIKREELSSDELQFDSETETEAPVKRKRSRIKNKKEITLEYADFADIDENYSDIPDEVSSQAIELSKKINRTMERIGAKSRISVKSIEIIESESTPSAKVSCPICKNRIELKTVGSRISLHNLNLHLTNAHKFKGLLRSKKRQKVRSLHEEDETQSRKSKKRRLNKPKKTVEFLYEKIVWKLNQIMSRTSREERVVLDDVEIIREDDEQEEDNSSNLKVEVKCPICRQVVRLSFNSYFAISANNLSRHLEKKDGVVIGAQTSQDSFQESKKPTSNRDLELPELHLRVVDKMNDLLKRSTLKDRLTKEDIRLIVEKSSHPNESKRLDHKMLKATVKCPVCCQHVRIQFSAFLSIGATNFKRHLIFSHKVKVAESNSVDIFKLNEETAFKSEAQSEVESSAAENKVVIHKKRRKKTRQEIKAEQPKEFPCPECDEIFDLRSSLTNHLKSHTRHTRDLIVLEKTYFCDMCDNIYKSKVGLRSHIHVMHLNRREFECDECGRCYTTSSVLREHKKNVHWRKNFLSNIMYIDG